MNNMRGLLDMAPMPYYPGRDDARAETMPYYPGLDKSKAEVMPFYLGQQGLLMDDTMPMDRIMEILLSQSSTTDLKKQIEEMLKRKTQGTMPVANPGRPTPMGGVRG